MNRIHKIVTLFLMIGIALLFTSCMVKGNVVGLSDYSYDNSEKYIVGEGSLSDSVENIEIDWMDGNVKILPHSLDTISFSEESEKELTEDMQIHYWLDQTTLHIKFCSCGKWDFSDFKKELTILVPSEQTFTNLKINSLSADIVMKSIQAETANVATISGNINIEGCSITQLVKMSTLSGGVEADFAQPLNEFKGGSTSGEFKISAPSISRVDVGTINGKVTLSVQLEPEELDIETTSGDIHLDLPENASFVLNLDTTSGDFKTDLTYEKSLGKYIFGDGNKAYDIETVSGNVQIKMK